MKEFTVLISWARKISSVGGSLRDVQALVQPSSIAITQRLLRCRKMLVDGCSGRKMCVLLVMTGNYQLKFFYLKRNQAMRILSDIRKLVVILGGIFLLVVSSVKAGQIVKIENWKPCSIGDNPDKDIPEWAKSVQLRPYYGNNIRALSIHGLCNEKFKRVVLCDPNMDELDPTHKSSAYNVCRMYFNKK